MGRRYKIVLAFDGTAYSGYQLQSNGVTVQQRLEEALAYLDQRPVRAYGSSRTDAGVHARGFCCHFDREKPIPVTNLVRAMNARLPEDIRGQFYAMETGDHTAYYGEIVAAYILED